MTADDFEQIAEVSQYGAQRRQEWMQRMQAHSDMATSAALAAHGAADHKVITAGQQGIMGDVSPQQQAAIVASQRRVGEGTSAPRDLTAAGGTIPWEAYGSGPAPARVDLSRIDTQGREPGVSPLWQRMHGGG